MPQPSSSSKGHTILPTPATTTVRLPEEKNLDRQIDICRKGAARDGVRVLITRTTKKQNRETTFPIIEITPKGEVMDYRDMVPRLRTPIRTLVTHTNTLAANAGALTGYAALSALVARADDYMEAVRVSDEARRKYKFDQNQQRRDRQAQKASPQPA